MVQLFDFTKLCSIDQSRVWLGIRHLHKSSWQCTVYTHWLLYYFSIFTGVLGDCLNWQFFKIKDKILCWSRKLFIYGYSPQEFYLKSVKRVCLEIFYLYLFPDSNPSNNQASFLEFGFDSAKIFNRKVKQFWLHPVNWTTVLKFKAQLAPTFILHLFAPVTRFWTLQFIWLFL